MARAILLGSFLFLLLPSFACAATSAVPFEISGWIPYWRNGLGTPDALTHIDKFTSIMPFEYIVQNDGSIFDGFKFNSSAATSTLTALISTAKLNHVKVVPSVQWSNAAAIDRILRSASERRMLVENIVGIVTYYHFDGIDIDFENKLVKTRPYFALFLKELYQRIGNKLVYCTIQPRTPAASAFMVVPATLVYADDYVAINKYCDRVEIMAYDQGSIDLALNASGNGVPYVPVADSRWVEKVINETAKYISKKKIIVGVATYGYEYELRTLTQGYKYDLDWAFNPRYALTLANELGITPARNVAGEMSFIYTPTTTPTTAATTTQTQHIVWWSDASAINDKIALAKRLGLRGIAIFKVDGGEDPTLWNVLP